MRKLTSVPGLLFLLSIGSASCSDATNRPNFAGYGEQAAATADLETENWEEEALPSQEPNPKQPSPSATPVVATSPVVKAPAPTNPSGKDATVPVVVPEAPKDPCSGFSWESIQSPEDALCFKTADQLIASIPERVRSNFVLVHTTRSAQPASVTKPRIIVSSPDGSFIVATATDQSVSKDLEIAVYDNKKNVWNFAGIDYSQSPPKVETALCKTCHGTEPHPIWTEYPNWPSAFSGSQKLTSQEAAVLNEIASKKSTLPFVKHLVTKSSYREGSILYPASKYSGSENNQTLNIVIAIKAARSLVAKLYEKNIAENELLDIASEQMCGTRSSALSMFGIQINKELSHGLVGKDRDQVIWSGNAMGSYFIGLEILNQVFKRNPGIKSRLPQIGALVERKEFKFYRTENLKDFLAAEDDLKGSWQAVDNGWFRGTFRSSLKSGTAHCQELSK